MDERRQARVRRWFRRASAGLTSARDRHVAHDLAQPSAPRVTDRVRSTPWWEWGGLDVHIRHSPFATAQVFPRWWTIRPDEVAAAAHRDPLEVGRLLSMHPDGFVRQAAVEVLAGIDSPDVLPPLLVRTVDWVPEVRRVAIAAVERLVADGLAPPTIVLALPLLDQLATPGRRGAEWTTDLRTRLVASLGRDDLVAALDRHRRPVARAAARELIARGLLDEGVVAAALAAGDDVVARTVARAALDAAAPGDLDAVLARLETARPADLRATALHLRLTAPHADAADAAARIALLDRSVLVRGLAQRHLTMRGVDVAAIYRSQLDAEPRALTGLADVGGAADADLVGPRLDDPQPRVRALALLAWCRLRPDGGQREAVPRLQDPEPTVAAAARRALRGVRLPPATVDLLATRLVADPRAHARGALAGVLHGQGRWDRLVVALRVLRCGGDPDLRHRGQVLLGSARDGWNRSATTPSPERLAEARRLVDDPAVPLRPDVRTDLVDLLRSWA